MSAATSRSVDADVAVGAALTIVSPKSTSSSSSPMNELRTA